jgi:sigma-B regulation protein RsbU (phosphoserine phosphatase)
MRRRILVVDDEPGVLRAVCRILQESYEVQGAPSAEDALAVFDEFKPDLAVLDIRMPGMNGFELMKTLKTARPGLDVILMTGSADESDKKLLRAIRERAFYFIHKPFDREVLRTLVALCLEQRRLNEENKAQMQRLETVLAEARAFQGSLLPGPWKQQGPVKIHTRCVSAEALCGDFYDYTANSAGVVAFVVADVVGHGASAAMLTGVVKSSFRSCSRDGFDPRAVVERIWSGILTFRANRFVTLFCGRIDPETGSLEYVNAGHPPPILWSEGGTLELLDPSGPLVSPVWDSPRWERRTRDFSAGHHLLAYTDGVTEAPGPTDQFGAERVQAAVERTRGGGDALLDSVMQDVEEFMQGRKIDDDLTMMTVANLGRRDKS